MESFSVKLVLLVPELLEPLSMTLMPELFTHISVMPQAFTPRTCLPRWSSSCRSSSSTSR